MIIMVPTTWKMRFPKIASNSSQKHLLRLKWGWHKDAQHCLDHPQAAEEMGDRARRLIVENYTSKHVASNLNELYAAILKQELLPALY